ncbi:MAG TPA: hypothetical protein VH351_13265 [Bryobacteraceae bacterium]|nr:hypothetical protein [Bryobacteraceae bacterium]
MTKKSLAVAFLALSLMPIDAAEPPTASISNEHIAAQLYLPDARSGFYRGTRFDWSGVIYSLRFAGHEYYGPWFTKTNPRVHDFVYEGADIVAGPCSAITGPVNEFKPVGWDDATPGGTFVKIGIGALRKPNARPYDNYHLYEIADPGKWTVEKKADAIEFTHTLTDSSSGIGYVYRKNVELVSGTPQMLLRHTLKNTGTRTIETTVYNHNFLVLNHRHTGAGFAITLPFQIHSPKPPNSRLAEIRGNQIVYLNTLMGHDTVATPIQGFTGDLNDNRFRIENSAVGVGMSAHTNCPLAEESLWSIRSVIAVEPFIAISIAPGGEFAWTTTYDYFKLPRK